jgi:hypothetical protein
MVRFLADPAGATAALDPALVIAPYLSGPTRMELREKGIGYVDLTGNIWVSVRKPGLYVEAPRRLECNDGWVPTVRNPTGRA